MIRYNAEGDRNVQRILQPGHFDLNSRVAQSHERLIDPFDLIAHDQTDRAVRLKFVIGNTRCRLFQKNDSVIARLELF